MFTANRSKSLSYMNMQVLRVCFNNFSGSSILTYGLVIRSFLPTILIFDPVRSAKWESSLNSVFMIQDALRGKNTALSGSRSLNRVGISPLHHRSLVRCSSPECILILNSEPEKPRTCLSLFGISR
jgi:hypothetical protein